jgi:hypothetical protein
MTIAASCAAVLPQRPEFKAEADGLVAAERPSR